MIQAGIKEVKNNLSRYLKQVKEGNEVTITDRGKPIARIIKENSKRLDVQTALAPLIEKGIVVMPRSRLNKKKIVNEQLPGKSVSDMVIEGRRWDPVLRHKRARQAVFQGGLFKRCRFQVVGCGRDCNIIGRLC